jgi:hypothetical protein
MRIRPPSGSLNKYTSNKQGITYPRIDGNRDPDNLNHWYWQFTYKEPSTRGKLRSRAISVPRKHVATVRSMVAAAASVAAVLSFLQGK